MTLTPTTKFFATLALATLAVSVAASGYLWMYWRISVLDAALREFETSVAFKHQEQRQIGSLQTVLRDHGGDFDRLRALRVATANPGPFFQQFETLAGRAGTKIAIALNNAQPDSLSLRFSIEGPKENVAAMLELIDSSLYDLAIEHLAVENASLLVREDGVLSASVRDGVPSNIRLVIGVRVKTR